MGYYSDVALVLTSEGEKYLNKLIDSSNIKNDVVKLLKDADQTLERDDCILYSWPNIKWYLIYPEVAFIQSVLDSNINQDDFYFIRVGENIGDIEEHGLFYDNPFSLCPVSELSFS